MRVARDREGESSASSTAPASTSSSSSPSPSWWPFPPPKPAAFGMGRSRQGPSPSSSAASASSSPSPSPSPRSTLSSLVPSPAVAGERAAAATAEALARVKRSGRGGGPRATVSSSLSLSSMASMSSSSPSRRRRRRSSMHDDDESAVPRHRQSASQVSAEALRGGGDLTGSDRKSGSGGGGGGWWPFGGGGGTGGGTSSSWSSRSSSFFGGGGGSGSGSGNAANSPSSSSSSSSSPSSSSSYKGSGRPLPPPSSSDERILISEIVLQGVDDGDPRLARAARSALTMRPNFAYTLTEVQDDVRRVFDTGYFASATPSADDTRDGVRLTVSLKPYPPLRSLVVTGADALPTKVVRDAFAGQAGRTINYGQLSSALDSLSRWYDARGIPAKVAVVADGPDGSLDVHCAEPRVSSVSLVFVDRETGEPKAPPPGRRKKAGAGAGATTGKKSTSTSKGLFDDDDDAGFGDDKGGKKKRTGIDANSDAAEKNRKDIGDDESNDDDDEDDDNKHGSGYTKPSVVLRHLRTVPGRPWSSQTAREDIDAVYATGLFEDVNIVPSPAAEGSTDDDPRVDVTLSVCERKTGGLSAGGGISAQGAADGALPGFIGSASFSQRNLFGLGQKLAATLEVGQVDKLFRIHHSDPWILGDPHRTSRVASLQNTRSSGAPIYATVGGGDGGGGGGEDDDYSFYGGNSGGGNNGNNNDATFLSPSSSVNYFPSDADAGAFDQRYGGGSPSSANANAASAANSSSTAAAIAADADCPIIISRVTGGFEYSRPLSVGWTGTLGFGWQRAHAVDDSGRRLSTDAFGAPLTLAGGGKPDTLATALLRASYAGAGGNEALLSLEQALPLRPNWLNFNRVRARCERRASLAALGLPSMRATATARAGAVFGDLPPYEAFSLGGTNSVRGYGEGALGTGRSYAEATAELLFPLPVGGGALEGCVFADVGSDLDTGSAVPGDPASARGKPGSGAGVGVGVRVDSPVGPLRLEWALTDRRTGRFHLGIGSHG